MTREELIEQAAGAYRSSDLDGAPRASAAFYDLDEDDRRAAFAAARISRALEAALDPQGLSSTGQAVLSRIRRLPIRR